MNGVLSCFPHLSLDFPFAADAWPARESSQTLDIIRSGELPSDHGTFGQCRIFSLGPDAEDVTAEHFMLVATASSDNGGQFHGTFEGQQGLANSSSSQFTLQLDAGRTSCLLR